MVVALLSPGQGSQQPGFLAPFLTLPGAPEKLEWWSQIAGLDLAYLGTEATADEIADTAKTQPLLTAAALLIGGELTIPSGAIVAGHSVGELGAAALAGALTPEAAIALSTARGSAMASACSEAATGMIALVGGVESEVLAAIEEAGLTAANRNGAGQIVAAGPLEAIAKLQANPPAKARMIPLNVAGAFHTQAMAPARALLERLVPAITATAPRTILLSNKDGASTASGMELLTRIAHQVTRPVRWDLVQRSLADLGVTALIELPPAGVLTRLAKRTLPGVELLAINSPDDLKAARDLLSRHGGAPSIEPHVEFAITVAGVAGTFLPDPQLSEGDTIAAGETLGEIATRRGPSPVTASHAGLLTEWLAHPEDPVAVGQPLARLERGGAR